MSTVLSLAAVLVTAAVLALGWSRARALGRSALVVLSLLSVVAAVAVQVNRLTEAYPTGAVAVTAAAGPTGSRLLTVTVAGPASRLTLPMYVYLPAAYRTGTGRFPVIEALHGYPGTPLTWLRKLNVQSTLDREIAAGRMAPAIVLLPYQTPERLLDTECTNLHDGPQAETFLTADVPAFARTHYRVRTDRAGWGLTGYSAGAFCAINLALRHPRQYAAAASLSGYAEPGIDVGDGSQNTTNNPGWRLRHLPQPAIALWLGWAGDDIESARDSRRLAAAVHRPLALTTALVAHGGHSSAVWRQMEAPAFDWLSAHLARPLP
ncbi:alpha/beta hydrolase [Paractinoplanes maris]|uniref:alpha/beta hydrolase n=1 Tax=Paractinoplanes maris TaxID=1734446 RepID=UPI002021EE34|nr:alpha/beta hydrolase-fold protein [Actinoplanes maris]